MDNLAVIYELARQLGLIDLFFDIYGRYIWTAGLIIALLNCFFGYKLRKLWSVLAGFLLGAFAGLCICAYLQQSAQVALIAALIIGIAFAFLAFLLYRIGLLLLCTGLTAFTLWQLLPLHTGAALIIYIIIGIAVGIFALAKERITVSLATAIGGGWAAAWFLSLLTSMQGALPVVLLTILFSALGILVQLKPWKSKKYWQQEDEQLRRDRKEEKKRQAHRRKSKKKNAKRNKKEKKREKEQNRKRKLQKKQKNRQSDKTAASIGKPSSDRNASARQPYPPQNASVEQPYPPRNASVEQAYPPRNPSVQQPGPAQNPSSGQPLPSPGALSGASEVSSSAGKSPLDLSDVRSQLSQEVSEIFREQNQEDKS